MTASQTMSQKIAVAVVILLGVAALVFGLRSCSADTAGGPESKPGAAKTTPPPRAIKMSTTVISRSIKSRLDQVADRKTRVECPERVKQKIGTKFTCDVFFVDEPGTAAVSVASVEIDGPDGHFTWKAEPTDEGPTDKG